MCCKACISWMDGSIRYRHSLSARLCLSPPPLTGWTWTGQLNSETRCHCYFETFIGQECRSKCVFPCKHMFRIYQDAEMVFTKDINSGTALKSSRTGKIGDDSKSLLDLSPGDIVFYVGGYPANFTVSTSELKKKHYHHNVSLFKKLPLWRRSPPAPLPPPQPPDSLKFPMYVGCIEFFSFNDKAASLYNFHAKNEINLQTPCKRWLKHTTRADCCSSSLALGPPEVMHLETKTDSPRTGSQTCFVLLSSSSPGMCPQWRATTTRELDTAECLLIKSTPSSSSPCHSTLVPKTAWSRTSAVGWAIAHTLSLLCEFARVQW